MVAGPFYPVRIVHGGGAADGAGGRFRLTGLEMPPPISLPKGTFPAAAETDRIDALKRLTRPANIA